MGGSVQLDKPNIVIPLAASYNERGTDGYATTVTSGKDQRKINSVYERIVNPATGSAKFYLAKRPGFVTWSETLNAAFYQYLIVPSSGIARWVIGKNGNDNVAVNTSTTNSILNDANYFPTYIDVINVSGTEYALVQLKGSSGQKVYYSSSIGTWTEISDADFTGLSHTGKMESMDGFNFVLDSATNRIHNSDLNSISAWTATSFITKQIEQDTSMGLMRLGRILLAAGELTLEGFYNAGNTVGSPLGRIPQLSTRIGLSGRTIQQGVGGVGNNCRHYYCRIGSRLYFIGASTGRNGVSDSLFAFDGSRFERVSTPAIDRILSDREETTNPKVKSVSALSFLGNDAVAIGLDTAEAVSHKWLMFFPSLNEWFEWESSFVQPLNNGAGLFLGAGSVATRGSLRGADQWVDGSSTAYTMTHQFKLPSNGNHRKFMPMCGVIADTQTSAGTLGVEFSDDDYQTFSTARTIDLTSVGKKQLYRCGSYTDRAVRLTHSANTDCRLEAFVAKVTDK